MKFISIAVLILKKDLREELRRKENILASFFFAFLSLVLFHFSLDPTMVDISQNGSGLLWLIVLFAGSLFMGNIFRKEEENGTFYALLLAPADRGSIYLGKFLANLIFLVVLEFFLLFLAFIFLNVPIFNSFLPLLFTFFLVDIGYSALGTLISALLVHERGAALLYPLLLYPLLVPLFMAATTLTGLAISSQPVFDSPWLRLLLLFDILFLTAGLLLFEYAVEE
jgi:heme exporter protein B